MNKFIFTSLILVSSLLSFSQADDYIITKEFIEWQKKQFKISKHDSYNKHYEKLNRTISITAHISVLGIDTVLADSAIIYALEAVNRFYEPAGFQFSICKFNYFHGYEYDTLSIQPRNENAEELRRKNYEPYTINMYFVQNLQGGSGILIGGLAPFPGVDTTYASPPVPDYRGALDGQMDWVYINARNPLPMTIAHELGHYFGLLHPHDRSSFGPELAEDRTNCSTTGDLICDTPAEPTLSDLVDANCHYSGNVDRATALVDPTGHVYMPSTTNLMSYTLSRCAKGFTEEQFQRMIYIYYHYRTYLR